MEINVRFPPPLGNLAQSARFPHSHKRITVGRIKTDADRRPQTSIECYPCIRSVLLPMFPVAQVRGPIRIGVVQPSGSFDGCRGDPNAFSSRQEARRSGAIGFHARNSLTLCLLLKNRRSDQLLDLKAASCSKGPDPDPGPRIPDPGTATNHPVST